MTALEARLATTDADGNTWHAVGVHLVPVRSDGKILLGLRAKSLTLAPGRWATIGGKLDAGESAVAGAVRETREETGLIVDPKHLQYATTTHFQNDQGFGPALAMFFTTGVWDGQPRIMEPDKCDRLDWFGFDELPEPMVPYVANALLDIRDGLTTGSLGYGFSVFAFDGQDTRPDGGDAPLMPRGMYISRLPRVTETAAMLLTDDAGRVLLVHQTYRHDGLWSFVGGGCDHDERPRDAARREIAEELGLHIEPGNLLTVCSNAATDRAPLTNFLYDGGTLNPAQIAAITLADGEIDQAEFFTVEQAMPLLSAKSQGELAAALAARASGTGGVYLENGRRPTIRGGI